MFFWISQTVTDVPMQIDLASYGGIALAVVALIGAFKKLFKAWVDGKEPMLAFVLTMVLGVTAKLAGMFAGADVKAWASHVVALILTAAAAGVVHDKIVEPVLQGKDAKK